MFLSGLVFFFLEILRLILQYITGETKLCDMRYIRLPSKGSTRVSSLNEQRNTKPCHEDTANPAIATADV